jgi:ankyrin repeat protein
MAGIVQTIVREYHTLRGALNGAQSALLEQWATDRLLTQLAAYKQETGHSVLHHCVIGGCELELSSILACPFPFVPAAALQDVSSGASVLGCAADRGDVSMVRMLIAAGASMERAAGELESPLIQAVRAGHYETVNLFPVAVDDPVPLSVALQSLAKGTVDDAGRWPIFVHLARRSNVNIPSAGTFPLMQAIVLKLLNCATWLIRNCKGIDINQFGTIRRRRVPLVAACALGQIPVVRALLTDSTLDVNWTNVDGKGALFTALVCGHSGVARLLLADKRLVVDTRYNGGPIVNTAALVAASKERSDILACLLTNRKVAWNVADDDGFTALHQIIRTTTNKSNTATHEVLDLLLKQAPASVDHVAATGENAVLAAVTHNWPAGTLLKLLKHSRKRFEGHRQEHPHLLHTAAGHGNVRVCTILLACGYKQVVWAGRHPAKVATDAGHILLGTALEKSIEMPMLERAALAGLNKSHLNRLISTNTIISPHALWIGSAKFYPQRPANAAPMPYFAVLRTETHWTRVMHMSYPACFQTVVWLMLLCHWRLDGNQKPSLPIEMIHLIMTMLPRDTFCLH